MQRFINIMAGNKQPITTNNIKGYEEGQYGPYSVQLQSSGKIMPNVFINNYNKDNDLYIQEYDKDNDLIKILKSSKYLSDVLLCQEGSAESFDFKFMHPLSEIEKYYIITQRYRTEGMIIFPFDFENLSFTLEDNIYIGVPKRVLKTSDICFTLPKMQNVIYTCSELKIQKDTITLTNCQVSGNNIVLSNNSNINIYNSSDIVIGNNTQNVKIINSENISIGTDCTGTIFIQNSGCQEHKISIGNNCASSFGMILLNNECAKVHPINIQNNSAENGIIIIAADNGLIDIYTEPNDIVNIQLNVDEQIIINK